MDVINIKKKYLTELGYSSFEDWIKNKNHIYIGRNMDFYVKGTKASKWQNPFNLKNYPLEKSLELYEQNIRNSELWNELLELDGKILGCWCKPNKCHGDILIKLIEEKKLIFTP